MFLSKDIFAKIDLTNSCTIFTIAKERNYIIDQDILSAPFLNRAITKSLNNLAKMHKK